ncbi:MAG: hypothetical protein Q4A07_12335 [Coriobacteriales bacterium]|nr:hypothetical protein [Coriobacteriales bacterium]
MPEPVTRSGDTVSLLSRPTPYRRLHLLRDSYDNPGITPEQKSEVTSLIIKLAVEERERLNAALRADKDRIAKKSERPRGKVGIDTQKKDSSQKPVGSLYFATTSLPGE